MKKSRHLLAVLAVLSTALLAACGGGSGGNVSGGGSPGPIPAQGVYFGSYTIDGNATPVSVVGAISKDGYAYFGDGEGALYVLPPKIKAGSFNGTLTAYAPVGTVFPNGKVIVKFSVSGQAEDDGSKVTALSGKFSGADESGTFSIGYQDFSRQSPSLDSLAGTWQGFYWGSASTSISLTVAADGTLSGNDGYGCTISGHLTVVSGYDLIKANVKSSGNSGCAGELSGLGFAYTKDLGGFFGDATGTYIYFGASNANAGFVAELFK